MTTELAILEAAQVPETIALGLRAAMTVKCRCYSELTCCMCVMKRTCRRTVLF